VKPAFLCEYGAPFTWDWTMYRGWYKGKREFGSAAVPWEFCLAEWNAQFFGDRAFQISESEKANSALGSKAVPRWQGLASLGLSKRGWLIALRRTISLVRHVSERQLASFSHLGVSAISPWDTSTFGNCARCGQEPPGVQGGLGKPPASGFSPDYNRSAV
jgi:hypothetical protein